MPFPMPFLMSNQPPLTQTFQQSFQQPLTQTFQESLQHSLTPGFQQTYQQPQLPIFPPPPMFSTAPLVFQNQPVKKEECSITCYKLSCCEIFIIIGLLISIGFLCRVLVEYFN